MNKKKNYSSEEKTIILREHLEKNVPVSEIAEKYDLHPNIVYQWRKQLFEQAPQILTRSKAKLEERKISSQEERIAELEALLSKRESLISELAEEIVVIKKKTNGMDLPNNGLNRKLGMK
jgi:transposase-like protein